MAEVNAFFTLPAKTSMARLLSIRRRRWILDMRTLVIILALLAIGKVATVEWLYRSASDDVIVNAYRPRALEACGRDARRAFGLDVAAWSLQTPVRLEIGSRGGSIRIWQVEHPGWAQRFRNPYLHLTAGAPGVQVHCTYDVVGGSVLASKM